jgi:hypothetical protein
MKIPGTSTSHRTGAYTVKTEWRKVMANVYRVFMRAPTHGNGRYLCIVTDGIQSALSIAKSKCATDEVITSIDLEADDVIVDLVAVGSDRD